jgi:hypothetical protein
MILAKCHVALVKKMASVSHVPAGCATKKASLRQAAQRFPSATNAAYEAVKHQPTYTFNDLINNTPEKPRGSWP